MLSGRSWKNLGQAKYKTMFKIFKGTLKNPIW